MVEARPVEDVTRNPVSWPTDDPSAKPEEVNWISVRAHEVIYSARRIEARHFNIDARTARERIFALPFRHYPVWSDGNTCIAREAFVGPRFKRIFVESGIPILVAHQVLEFKPTPHKFISPATNVDIDSLRLRRGMVLVTCSGVNAGQIGFVNRTLDDSVASHDLFRLTCHSEDDAAWLYAFLRSRAGQSQLRSNVYGTGVPHLELEHLKNTIVPLPDGATKNEIASRVLKAYSLIDEANELLEQTDRELHERLQLPYVAELKTSADSPEDQPTTFQTDFSGLERRLEAKYHVPLVRELIQIMAKSPMLDLIRCGDRRVSRRIFMPGRFKRVYVEPEQGVPFLSSSNIMQFNPVAPKYLSTHQHGDLIDKLRLHENIILITCSGTIGRIQICPEYFHHFTASQHVIRLFPAPSINPGFVYAFLASDIGHALISRMSYGSVVPEIDHRHVASIPFPLPNDESVMDSIGELVLQANSKRNEAWRLEREAVALVDELVYRRSGPEKKSFA